MNPFRVGILQYAGRGREIQYIAKFMPPTLKKGDDYDQSYLTVLNKELSENEIGNSTNDELSSSMQDEMEDKDNNYSYLPHK